MRFFATGVSGFAGSHLAALLLESGHEVFGLAKHPFQTSGPAIPRERFWAADLADRDALRDALRTARPHGIFHLAGLAFPPSAARDREAAYQANFAGSVALLAAAREIAPDARIVFVTSGEVYGRITEADLPLREDQPLRPATAYALSKAAADLAGLQAHLGDGLDVVRARPFNHTGPGQSPEFVCSEFARAIAAAELGVGPPTLRVGNLDVERDFSDVRDVVRGYVALYERGRAGEAYHLAAGKTVSVRWVLERLLATANARVSIEIDPSKLRPLETKRVEVSIEKIQADTGWRPEIPLEQTLRELSTQWRKELG